MSTVSLEPGPPVFAFDVGGTDVKSALVDETGLFRELAREATVTDSRDPAGALTAQLAKIAGRMQKAHPDIRPVAAGVSIPGIVDEEHRRAVLSAAFGWQDAPVFELAEAALGLPVAFGHDVRRAGEAELRLGSRRDARSALIVTIGTGIAATVVVDGKILTGGGFAGELGHMVSDPLGEPCGCGGHGCLQTVASAAAIARRYTERSGIAVGGARDVLERVDADPAASEVWHEAVDALALALQRISVVLAPEAIVIGGGLAMAGDRILDPLRERLNELETVSVPYSLTLAELGEDAGLIGTALAARELAAAREAKEAS